MAAAAETSENTFEIGQGNITNLASRGGTVRKHYYSTATVNKYTIE